MRMQNSIRLVLNRGIVMAIPRNYETRKKKWSVPQKEKKWKKKKKKEKLLLLLWMKETGGYIFDFIGIGLSVGALHKPSIILTLGLWSLMQLKCYNLCKNK